MNESHKEELKRSEVAVKQTFAQLRQWLDERQFEVESKLAAGGQLGCGLLEQRQLKAADLKNLADNAQHLSDPEIVELKADIKVSLGV